MRARGIVAVAAVVLVGTAAAGPKEDALMAVDKAFNEMAQKDGVAAAFKAYAAPDARMFRGEEKPVSGPAAIDELMALQYSHGGTLEWSPVEAVAAEDGSMGFTHGRWLYTSPAVDGTVPKTSKGSYVTIWGRQPDGSYKYTVDIGNPDSAPAAAPDSAPDSAKE